MPNDLIAFNIERVVQAVRKEHRTELPNEVVEELEAKPHSNGNSSSVCLDALLRGAAGEIVKPGILQEVIVNNARLGQPADLVAAQIGVIVFDRLVRVSEGRLTTTTVATVGVVGLIGVVRVI